MSGRTVTSRHGAGAPARPQLTHPGPLLEATVLMLVRENDTPETLAERRRLQSDEVAAIAAAPVQHLPAEFLLAVEGLFPELVSPQPTRGRSAAR